MKNLFLKSASTSVLVWGLAAGHVSSAATVKFFEDWQIAIPVSSGTTSDTVNCDGYQFTYTRDKLFTGGGTEPIGRYVRMPWPQGVESQAVTAGPNPSKATIRLQRMDSEVFDLTAFTANLLANTGAAGGAIEIMPSLNGEDGFADPLAFSATGSAGQSFSFDESTPSYLGNTSPLKNFDRYTITLYVDFALTGLTLQDAFAAPRLAADYDGNGWVDNEDLAVWQGAFGATAAADCNGDGVSDGFDFMIWQRALGQPAVTSISTVVPEPGGWISAGVVLALIGCRRRRSGD
jgi:hypothetical protein